MNLDDTNTELLTKTPLETTTLKFANGAGVQSTPQIKHLGAMMAWEHPFQVAFLQRASLADKACKKKTALGLELQVASENPASNVPFNHCCYSTVWARLFSPDALRSFRQLLERPHLISRQTQRHAIPILDRSTIRTGTTPPLTGPNWK